MATLQRIRNTGPVIVIVIGLALVAFLLGDVNKLFSRSDTDIAEINGTPVSIQEYQARFKNYEEGMKMLTGKSSLDEQNQKYVKDQVWDKIVKNYSLSGTYEDLGLEVSDLELAKIVSGENIQTGLDPLTRQIFTDPNTRQFNSQAAVNFFQNANQSEEGLQVAKFLENEMRDNRKFTKYASLISKGMNVTNFEAKSLYKERVNVVDFDYTSKKYNSVADSTVSVTEKELKEYYDSHKNDYEQKESRDIAYITLNIIPSEEDFQVAEKDIEYYKAEFAEISVDTSINELIDYVNANSEVPFDEKHYSLEELGDTALFNASSDSVFGPDLENGSYVLKRVFDRVTVPDTVGARHILIQVDGQVIKDINRAEEIADSLKTLIKNGSDFAQLAKDNSADKGSAEKGGDLDKFTEGRMVRPFSDACFKGNVGDIVIVKSQYGVHLIEITYQSKPKKEKVRIAKIINEVRPGNNTISGYFATARDLSVNSDNNTDKFDELIEKEHLTKKIATEITPETEIIAGVNNPDAVIRWIYKDETGKGSVSEPFQDGDIFIVAAVTEVREDGTAPFNQVKEDVTVKVRKEKKGEMFVKEMQDISSFDKTAKNISFSSSRLNDDGIEYAVIATGTQLEKDKISKPIIGENGVYVLKVTSKTGVETVEDKDVENDKMNAERRLYFTISRQIFDALKDAAEVQDDRAKFF
ncbi:MAG: hypothetical protein DRI94_06555 [Bacteroidetes bacterium]|nr:MAG: hypothetical protein DRI94_06555 [Bacteroidota bacterium]